MNDNYKKTISAVIATKNEERNIRNCLESLKMQNYPQELIELIVVDNGSKDKTREIALKYTKSVFNLEEEKNLDNIKNFRGAQVNFGVEKSSGNVIFFPDADMSFDKDLISEAMEKIKEYDALFIPEEVRGKGFLGKVRNFERSFYNETCIDAVRIIKKDIFIKAGEFDIKNIFFGPDDWDFTKTLRKNRFKLGITRNIIYHNEKQMNWTSYVNKKGKYMHTFESYIKKWGKEDKDIEKQFGIYYRYLGVFFENGKWKKLIAHPILTFGMYFLRFLVGIKFLTVRK